MSQTKNWGNKQLIYMIATLAWPTILDQLLQTIVIYADTAMVGRIGANASASVGLVTPVTWLINGPIFGLGIGVLAFISRNNGAKKYDEIKVAAMQAIYLALICGGLFSVVIVAISPYLPAWLGGAPEIQWDTTKYLAITGGATVFRSVSIVLGCALRGTGDTKTPMINNTLMNVINVILNFLFIYDSRVITIGSVDIPMWGAGLGVAGAALGTAVACIVGSVMMVIAVFKNEKLSPLHISKKVDKRVMGQCVKVGIPLAIQRIAIFSGHTVFTSMVAHLGTVLLAAHSIAISAEELFYIPGFGMQEAGSTLVGNAMGEGDEKKMDRLARLLILITTGLMTITGALLFIFPEFMMKIFTEDPEVIAAGVIALRIVAVSEPIYGALIMLEGIFNGVGNTKTTFVVGVGTMWGIRVIFTAICVYVLDMGLASVWVCMVAENVAKALILGVLFLRGNWKKGAAKYS